MHIVIVSLLTATSLVPVPAPLAYGDAGPEVTRLQRSLGRLRYAPGDTGVYDSATRAAVWAFQKGNGIRPMDGVDAATWRALRHPRRPPRSKSKARRSLEISLRRQRLILYERGRVKLITHISTGTRERYCVRGRCGRSITPVGAFRVQREIGGWRVGRLGPMYKPMYFHGGIAVHGSARVPLHPASHGCVRVPMNVADLLSRAVRKGDAVRVTR